MVCSLQTNCLTPYLSTQNINGNIDRHVNKANISFSNNATSSLVMSGVDGWMDSIYILDMLYRYCFIIKYVGVQTFQLLLQKIQFKYKKSWIGKWKTFV